MGLTRVMPVRNLNWRPVKIFLLIESRILRENLARLFRKRTDLRVVGQSPYSGTIAAQVAESLCDVLLMDQPTLVSSSSNAARVNDFETGAHGI